MFFSSQDKKEKYGALRYYGRPEFAAGVWCGVELDKPEGRNNGSKHGIRYFTCDPVYGVFVPVEKVQRDLTRRPRSRPNSRPNSRPTSADRGRKGTHTEAVDGLRVRPAAVQQELARLVQLPGTDQLTRRKPSQNTVMSNSRQPLKAFARSKDDTTIGKQSIRTPMLPFRTGGNRGMLRAASSENLQALKESNKGVKKSSSERNLKAGNTLPRTTKSSKSPSRSQTDPCQHWPRNSTPKADSRESDSVSIDGAVCSHSSSSSSRGPSPDHSSSTNNGFNAAVKYPLHSGLSTPASQLVAELEELSVGTCRVPSPVADRNKTCYQNRGSSDATLMHPLSHATELPGNLTPQTIMQLLTELIEQNHKLCQRQGIYHYILTCSHDATSCLLVVCTAVLEQKLEVIEKQWHSELRKEVAAVQLSLEQSMLTVYCIP